MERRIPWRKAYSVDRVGTKGVPTLRLLAQGARLDAKFDTLAAPVLGAARANTLKRLLERLESVFAQALLVACAL